jgi:hypothetical protein
MRRPRLSTLAAICLMAAGGAACAQIAGLPDFSSGSALDGSSKPDPPSGDDQTTGGDEPSTTDDQGSGDLVTVGDIDGGDVDSGDMDSGDGDAGAANDGDASQGHAEAAAPDAASPDASAVVDAGAPSDASEVPDGYVCGPGTCSGCCTSTGGCAGGQSVNTCGVGGASCKDCKSSGACSAGACSTPVKDAAPPPMCVVSVCQTTNPCAGAPFQGVCCKSDETCGCQWTAFAPCL